MYLKMFRYVLFLLPIFAQSIKYGLTRAKPSTIGSLYENLDHKNVDKVYFSEDLKYVYFQEITDEDGEEIPAFRMAVSNPLMTDRIIETTEKNGIHPIFLQNPPNPVVDTVRAIGDGLNFLFPPFILFLILRSFFTFQQGIRGQGQSPFFSNPMQKTSEDKTNMQKANITLDSWKGSPEVFQECTEIVSFLKNSTVFQEAGAEIPKGILLEGPPGTGKTLIAKAIAGETDAWFLAVSASEFIELFVGLGAQKIRNVFKTARENKPAIIFIDEIDSIGRQRGTGINMGNDEREQTLNQLLAEMDGFAQNDGIIVIAATNRRDVLDAALLRPGRFDRIVNVPLPDRESRKDILQKYMGSKKVAQDIDVGFLAEITAGFSGAELKNLLNEAAILTARNGKSVIEQQDLEDALEKLVVGIVKKTDTRSEDARKRVAIHEIGHAFLTEYFRKYFQLKKVTIQSTYNGAGGYTLFNEYPDIIESGLYTKDLLKKKLVVALGGKAAEQLFYGREQVSLGAIQDLKQANSIARRMIGNYGMGNELEVFYNENMESGQTPFLGRSLASSSGYADYTMEKMDKEALNLVDEAYLEALNILTSKRSKVSMLVKKLEESITLSGNEVTQLLLDEPDNTSISN
jgi:cell division protease FtsH